MTPLQLINVKKVVYPIRKVDTIMQMNPRLKELLEQAKSGQDTSCGATLENMTASAGQDYVTVGCCTGKNQDAAINHISDEELRKIVSEIAKQLR